MHRETQVKVTVVIAEAQHKAPAVSEGDAAGASLLPFPLKIARRGLNSS